MLNLGRGNLVQKRPVISLNVFPIRCIKGKPLEMISFAEEGPLMFSLTANGFPYIYKNNLQATFKEVSWYWLASSIGYSNRKWYWGKKELNRRNSIQLNHN